MIARTAAALVAALMLVLGTALAREVDVDTDRDGEAVIVRAVGRLEATPDAAWRVLTDYAGYARFIPDLRRSRVLARDGDRVIIEQEGDARLLWIRVPMQARLEVTEFPPRLVESRQLSGSMQSFVGRYEIEPVGDRVRLLYTGRLVLDAEHRGLFDGVAIRSNARRQFAALAAEIERVARGSE